MFEWTRLAGVLPDALRSTSMPVEAVAEPLTPTAADLDGQLLELFFDRVPMGIAVFDTDMRLVRCNRTWIGFYEHYFGVEPGYVAPGKHLNDLIPGNEESVAMLAGRALAGNVVRQAAHRIDIPGAATYWDVVFAPLFENGRVVGAVDIVTDATDRVNSLQRLEARIAAFTAIAAGMTVDQPLDALLNEVVARVLDTTAAVGCSIVSWHDDRAPEPVAHVGWGAMPGLAEALGRTLTEGWRELVGPEAGPQSRLEHHRGFRMKALADPLFARMRPYWQAAAWDDLIVVPLTASGRTFGEMHVALPAGAPVSEDDETYLIAIADEAAVAAQNAALFATAASSATLIERQRLARDLHDSVSQALFSMTLHAATAERHLLAAIGADGDSPVRLAGATEQVQRLKDLTAGALAEMRAMIFELRPDALAEEGLPEALRKQAIALAARTGIPIDVEINPGPWNLTPQVEEHLYRIALEALHNAIKHASATRLTVQLDATIDGRVYLSVTDDGIGFDPLDAWPGHLGQQTMADRAAAIGAVFTIDSAPGRGTQVIVDVPVG